MKKVLFLATALPLSAINNVNAYDFSDKIYGKANFSVGYSYQTYNSKDIENIESNNNKIFHTFNFGIGCDLYYKFNDLVNPFIGLDIEGRVPIKTNIIKGAPMNPEEKADDFWRINDFLSTHLKLGLRFNVVKNISISPYGLIGFTLLQSSSKGYVGFNAAGEINAHSPSQEFDATTKYNLSKTYIGLSAGAGLNFVYDINDKISLFGAVEYQMHSLKDAKINSHHHLIYDEFVGGNDSETWAGCKKVNDYQSHQVSVKLGVQFL